MSGCSPLPCDGLPLRVDHLVYHLAWPRPAAMCSLGLPARGMQAVTGESPVILRSAMADLAMIMPS